MTTTTRFYTDHEHAQREFRYAKYLMRLAFEERCPQLYLDTAYFLAKALAWRDGRFNDATAAELRYQWARLLGHLARLLHAHDIARQAEVMLARALRDRAEAALLDTPP